MSDERHGRTGRRADVDTIASTGVVIDRGDRPAALPAALTAWLSKRGES